MSHKPRPAGNIPQAVDSPGCCRGAQTNREEPRGSSIRKTARAITTDTRGARAIMFQIGVHHSVNHTSAHPPAVHVHPFGTPTKHPSSVRSQSCGYTITGSTMCIGRSTRCHHYKLDFGGKSRVFLLLTSGPRNHSTRPLGAKDLPTQPTLHSPLPSPFPPKHPQLPESRRTTSQTHRTLIRPIPYLNASTDGKSCVKFPTAAHATTSPKRPPGRTPRVQ